MSPVAEIVRAVKSLGADTMVITGVVVPVATVAFASADETDVTVPPPPPPVPLAAAVILPFASTVRFVFVYEPGVTAVAASAGDAAVPARSPASSIIPFEVVVASGTATEPAGWFVHLPDGVSYVNTSLLAGLIRCTSVSEASVEEPAGIATVLPLGPEMVRLEPATESVWSPVFVPVTVGMVGLLERSVYEPDEATVARPETSEVDRARQVDVPVPLDARTEEPLGVPVPVPSLFSIALRVSLILSWSNACVTLPAFIAVWEDGLGSVELSSLDVGKFVAIMRYSRQRVL
jgi:hypothetical protein